MRTRYPNGNYRPMSWQERAKRRIRRARKLAQWEMQEHAWQGGAWTLRVWWVRSWWPWAALLTTGLLAYVLWQVF